MLSAAGGSRRRAAFSVLMDAKTHHLYKPVMIGRITDDGRILPVSVTEGLVPPDPWSPWLAALGFAGRSRLRAVAATHSAWRE